MLSFTCERLARTAARREPTGGAPGRGRLLAIWGDRPQGTPRLVLQRNPRPIRKIKGQTLRQTGGGGPWSGGVRLRTIPGLFPPRFGVRCGRRRVAREPTTPIARRLTSRKAWANDIGSEVRQRARGSRMPRHLVPAASGLFDPRASTMLAASASSPTSRADKSHQIIKDALDILENLEHRGAVGADPIAGDGAGILIQIPHEFLRRGMRRARDQAAEARPLCRRPPLHAAGRAAARALRARVDAHHPRGGPGVPRLALGAGRQLLPVRDGQGAWSRCTGRSSSAGRRR